MPKRTIQIKVPALARVEGEGALEVDIQAGAIRDLKLRIYEPPRYFEKFLEGREYHEVPDIVARICGICPVAYQMSAVQALEAAFGMTVSPWVRAMRRVMYCGEWIQSHSLHIHMLAAPDYLGVNNITEMARDHAAVVQRGLRLQALGNRLIELFGGRSVHPVGVRVGGFTRQPDAAKAAALIDALEQALPEAEALIHWTAALPLPTDEQDFTCVALRHASEYPLYEGRLVSSAGLDIDRNEFEQHFTEHQVPHSTALHCLLDGRPYLVGPLARLNLNYDRLPAKLRSLLDGLPVRFPSYNMFHSIVARAVEIHFAMQEALRLLRSNDPAAEVTAGLRVRAGVGYGCSEAPRGILWHRYAVDAQGRITAARIVPPTSQNQARIEQDLHTSLTRFGLEQAEDTLRLHGEKLIRNYDPCISCATHFLKLKVRREEEPVEVARQNPTHSLNSSLVRIIGIGSPHGADSFGWTVVDYLQAHGSLPAEKDIVLKKLDRPGTRLLEEWQGSGKLIIIDAVDLPARQGEVIMLHANELEVNTTPLSGHQLGVAEALSFASRLGMDTGQIILVGWSVPTDSDCRSLDETVKQAARLVMEQLAV